MLSSSTTRMVDGGRGIVGVPEKKAGHRIQQDASLVSLFDPGKFPWPAHCDDTGQ
jgi:hypothetical protein